MIFQKSSITVFLWWEEGLPGEGFRSGDEEQSCDGDESDGAIHVGGREFEGGEGEISMCD